MSRSPRCDINDVCKVLLQIHTTMQAIHAESKRTSAAIERMDLTLGRLIEAMAEDEGIEDFPFQTLDKTL